MIRKRTIFHFLMLVGTTILTSMSAHAGEEEFPLLKRMEEMSSAEACRRGALDLGLFPLQKCTEERLDRLTKIFRAGFDEQALQIEAGDWITRPEYRSFFLYYVLDNRPRLRVQNYIGEWEIFPSLVDFMKDDDWLTVQTDPWEGERLPHEFEIIAADRLNQLHLTEAYAKATAEERLRQDQRVREEGERLFWLARKVERLRNTKTYRKARAWEQGAMVESLRVDSDFVRFTRDVHANLPLFDFSLGEVEGSLGSALTQEILAQAQQAFSSSAVYRLAVQPGDSPGEQKILAQVSGPLGRQREAIYLDEAHDLPLPPPDFLSDSHIREIVLAAGLMTRPLANEAMGRIWQQREAVLLKDPALASRLEALMSELKKAEAAGEQVKEVLQSLRPSTQARIFLSRYLPLPGRYDRALLEAQRLAKQAQVIKEFSEPGAAVVRTAPAARAWAAFRAQSLIGKLCVLGVGAALTIDALDLFSSAREHGLGSVEASRRVSRLVVDGAFAVAFSKAALARAGLRTAFLGLSRVGLITLVASVGAEVIRHTIEPDFPTMGDGADVCVEALSDGAQLFYQDCWQEGLRKRNRAVEDWERIRREAFSTFVTVGGEVIQDDPDYAERAQESRPQRFPLLSPEGYRAQVLRIMQEQGISFSQRGTALDLETIAALESLSQNYAVMYLKLALAASQFAGNLNENMFLKLLDLVARARANASFMALSQRFSQIEKRQVIFDGITAEIDRFLVEHDRVRMWVSMNQPKTEPLALKEKKSAVSEAILSVIYQIENCAERNQDGRLEAVEPCDPTPLQKETVAMLLDVLREVDPSRFPEGVQASLPK